MLEATYVAVVLGAFIEGEGVMLAAGGLARAGKLDFASVVLAGAAGSFVWGQTWFRVGRHGGAKLLAARPAWSARLRAVPRLTSKLGSLLYLSGRFMPGMGTVLPAAIGAARVGPWPFMVFDGVGALLWSAVFAGAGFGATHELERRFGREFGSVLAVAVLTALVAAALSWQLVRRFRTAASCRGQLEDEAQELGRQLIVTADDFGLAEPFNEAVELAHRAGSLTAASLMLGQKATPDAIERARRNPHLRVGIHLTLCEGLPTLSPGLISLLVNRRGEFYGPVRTIVRLVIHACRRDYRAQLESEIRAQFRAFTGAGLSIDHVSGHNNLHLHPVVLPILLRVAREFGAAAVRVPYEPPLAAWRAANDGLVGRLCVWAVMGPWTWWARQRLEREGFVVNDYLFGVFDCGAMVLSRLLALVAQLPAGVSEIHVHPATRRCPEIEKNTPTYEHEAELAALLDPRFRQALASPAIRIARGFGDLSGGHVRPA